jgi:type I restriction enzyme M protein
MSSNQSGEGEIRKAIVEADLVDCMVAMPGQLFYSTQIPVCLWFIARNKRGGKSSLSKGDRSQSERGDFRDRRGETLFIDARKLGTLTDRVHREMTDADVAKIAGTYHAWRGDSLPPFAEGGPGGIYEDIPGFCKSATIDEIRKHGHVLTPGRYVGAEAVEDDGEPFDEKMKRLVATLREQQAEAAKLDAAIAENMLRLGFPLGGSR